MPRPGFVLDVDRSTPPTLFWHGEGFSLEKLPADRSRVIYPPEPLAPLDDIDGAIRHALLNPLDQDPLPTLLFPGMKLTIAFDDISLPLPKMRRPDVRQRVIEAVLDMAAEAGVDDVHLICALALHRRMTEAELRHAIGDRVYDAFEPRGMLYQHDAEDPDNLDLPRHHAAGRGGRDQQAGGDSRPARLRQHQPRRDGRRVEVDGHRPGQLPQPAPPPQPDDDGGQPQLHGPAPLASCTRATGGWARCCVDSGVKVFQIETTLNTDTFPAPFDFLSKREWEWTPKDRATYLGTAKSLSLAPTRLARKILHSIEAPHQMTSVQAGEVEAVHKVTTENVYRQQLVEVEGQTDILTMGIPYICPYNVNSIMNPILVMCMGLGYLFNLYRGKPLVREGGVVIMTHPTQPDFHPVHHPSYIDFYEQVLADTTDPHVMSKQYEERYANDEWYRHLYRTGNAYHGVHPFYMWYWGAHGDAPLRAGDHRRRRPEGRAPARVHAGVDARRRARDRRPTSSAARRRSPTSTTRRS